MKSYKVLILVKNHLLYKIITQNYSNKKSMIQTLRIHLLKEIASFWESIKNKIKRL